MARNGERGYPLKGKQGHIIASLGKEIVQGRYAPGSLLPHEVSLLKTFDASRVSLREAVKILAAKGLVETRQKVGTLVRARNEWNLFDPDVLQWHDVDRLDETLLRDLIEIRMMIEPGAARFAAMRGSLDDHRQINRALSEMRKTIAQPPAYQEADIRFHSAVFAASHNQFLIKFCELILSFLDISFSVQHRAVSVIENDVDVEEHAAVLRAINAGDGEAAEAAMRRVVLSGREALQAALGVRAA